MVGRVGSSVVVSFSWAKAIGRREGSGRGGGSEYMTCCTNCNPMQSVGPNTCTLYQSHNRILYCTRNLSLKIYSLYL